MHLGARRCGAAHLLLLLCCASIKQKETSMRGGTNQTWGQHEQSRSLHGGCNLLLKATATSLCPTDDRPPTHTCPPTRQLVGIPFNQVVHSSHAAAAQVVLQCKEGPAGTRSVWYITPCFVSAPLHQRAPSHAVQSSSSLLETMKRIARAPFGLCLTTHNRHFTVQAAAARTFWRSKRELPLMDPTRSCTDLRSTMKSSTYSS